MFLLQRCDVRGLVDDQQCVFRQVVEQRSVREERHVVVVSVERLSFAQHARLVVEALSLLAAQVRGLHVLRERAHAGRVDRKLARWPDADSLALRFGALRDRVEGANTLDVVAE